MKLSLNKSQFYVLTGSYSEGLSNDSGQKVVCYGKYLNGLSLHFFVGSTHNIQYFPCVAWPEWTETEPRNSILIVFAAPVININLVNPAAD